jgi:hypothetical protein
MPSISSLLNATDRQVKLGTQSNIHPAPIMPARKHFAQSMTCEVIEQNHTMKCKEFRHAASHTLPAGKGLRTLAAARESLVGHKNSTRRQFDGKCMRHGRNHTFTRDGKHSRDLTNDGAMRHTRTLSR